ncbi:hypothetical protein [Anabaena sp. PCC 7108]|uniref:hypothetical protein n=1 Tax=Anabaena sp. PCC 7108 TaxID=163908 RepID=UPI0003486A69|nr:hypothetical protein [Anabaena sp. PCC 7108]
MSQINKWYFFLIYLLFSNIYPSISLAAGGGNPIVSPESNTTPTPDTANTNVPTNTNTTATPYTETSPYLNTNNQSISAFSSSFSGYSSYSNQCGLSMSGGYVNNGNQDSYQILTTFNTNPCTNQSNLENIRQKHETSREVIRANATIITVCINARSEAVKNRINPDTICKLNDFQMPRTP